ncbi:MAG TPA: DUF4956 domain-containing protein [Anaerolineaceae bacterium]|jgi:hypothetical protein|nr:DUF4956 domain-containing protein [Anaerolineaceae bacterium]HPK26720.1 DUF4956 domain-containing protein [Anaerolineaceae bacterium]
MSDLTIFLLGFLVNFVVGLIIVRFIYYPRTKDKRFVFTYLTFSTVIYFVVSLMANITIGIGVGFGLFAIFRIVRYRTEPMPVREMTYLFVLMSLPVMNSSGMLQTAWPQLIIANAVIALVLWLLEKEWGFEYQLPRHVVYEKIELIQPSRQAEMVADLEARTGRKVERVEVGKIDFLKDTADLRVYFAKEDQNGWSVPELEEDTEAS